MRTTLMMLGTLCVAQPSGCGSQEIVVCGARCSRLGKAAGLTEGEHRLEPDVLDVSGEVTSPFTADWWEPQARQTSSEGHHAGDLVFYVERARTGNKMPPHRALRHAVECRTDFSPPGHGRTAFRIEYYAGPERPEDWSRQIEDHRANGFAHQVFFAEGNDSGYGVSALLRPVSAAQAGARPSQFVGKAAIIYLAGIKNDAMMEAATVAGVDEADLVDNTKIASSLTTIPMSLICRMMQWNLRPQSPPHAGKLDVPPAYVQIVPNQNGIWRGIKGQVDDSAAKTFAANLWLAYQAGVEQVEVLTHSNGMVTAHHGYQRFIEEFISNSGDGLAVRRRQSRPRTAGPMRINFVHMQAAPSDPDRKETPFSFVELGKLGFFEQAQVEVAFRFFYDKDDQWTFQTKSVGSDFSAKWVERLNAQHPSRDLARQYLLPRRGAFEAKYGRSPRSYSTHTGGHEQRGVLEWFSDSDYDTYWQLDPRAHPAS